MDQVQKRIFIVPVGIDSTRAKFPPVSPDQLYLITQHQDQANDLIDQARDNVREVYEHFSHLPSRVVYGVDNFFDLSQLMSLLRYLCDHHEDDQIFINVGSGSKLTAMAGFMISGWYENVQCYYPKMKVSVTANSDQKIVHNQIERTELIRSFPVRKLDEDLVPVLNYLKNETRSKKELLEKLQDIDLIDTHFETDNGDMKERSPQSLYNLLKRNFLNPLEEEELITETSSGEVSLTDQGKRMQVIFGKSEFHIEQI